MSKKLKKLLESQEEELREEEIQEENGNGDEEGGGKKAAVKYDLPEYLNLLHPDRKQIFINLHVWASRIKFWKLQRQRMKNFISSLTIALGNKKAEFTKLFKLEEHVQYIEAIIKEIEKDIKIELESLPIWNRFLKNINGAGVGTVGPIVAYIGDTGRFHSISALRKYSGWFVRDGKAARKTSGSKLDYSPKLKQTLYQLIQSIIRGQDEYYYPFYLKTKEKIHNKHPEYEGRKATKGQKIEGIPIHIHKMAMRRTIQQFLSDYFVIWGDIEGLPPTTPYAIAVLGHENYIDPLKENPHYEKPLGY